MIIKSLLFSSVFICNSDTTYSVPHTFFLEGTMKFHSFLAAFMLFLVSVISAFPLSNPSSQVVGSLKSIYTRRGLAIYKSENISKRGLVGELQVQRPGSDSPNCLGCTYISKRTFGVPSIADIKIARDFAIRNAHALWRTAIDKMKGHPKSLSM